MEPIFATSRTAALSSRATPDELRGPGWEQRAHGLWRPAGMAVAAADGRVADAVALMTDGCVLGGWASLRLQGNEGFDGGGDVPRPALVHCAAGTQLRRREAVEPCRSRVWDHEVTELAGVPVTTLARATYDEMRLAPSVRAAVVALDTAVSRVRGTARTSLQALQQVIDSHRKTRGIVRAKRALVLGSERSASVLETRTRLVAELDADLTGLLVNAPVFDRAGTLLGVADLLDRQTGLVVETDGTQHREATQHTDDNVREERFERAGLVVVRVTALDHRDVPGLVRRLRLGQRDARMSRRRDWTLEQPAWFASWAPGKRWQ
ncbi:hypothetical protein AFL01nite_01220 [Aeromicrobium flavum]|uniref:DUF559 domain-containing protein n=1 Tax=Aeromicrobium flavum TaxID=416568 RepID=A0A512HQR6_9ACTN|nr:DUF559 domain-containing protein [Aeromicrobium flavum]GEO87795.1 hypothetical protein AFL01nite_01220 [Aeromicrobium flavum]